ncbi:hypothetical protein F4777DRAFT_580582 [Nemania sp. FL0916]|nr:hypothetical protein F4777DRAFT_580582 [Nemania sp. FL0916]
MDHASGRIGPEFELLRTVNCFTSEEDFQSEDWEAWQQYANWYIHHIKATFLAWVGADLGFRNALPLLLPVEGKEGAGSPPPLIPNTRDIISLLIVVTSSIRRGRSSMVEILDELRKSREGGQESDRLMNHRLSLPPNDENPAAYEGSRACQALFVLMSWILLLYTTAQQSPPGLFRLHLNDPSDNRKTLRSYSWTQLSCPVSCDLAGLRFEHLVNHFGHLKFQRLPSQPRWNTAVSASNVNYFILSRVARVRVVWVEALSLHLEFDRRTSTLKLFRFPSFCAMLSVPRASKATIFDHVNLPADHQLSLFSAGNDIQSQAHTDSQQTDPYSQDFFVEVLCSLRLIFGQNSRSRDLYRKSFQKPGEFGIDKDPLLDQICGAPSHQCDLFDRIDALPERSIYSPQHDFPYLGQRLLELQDFVTAQNPADLRTLWYDVRDLNRYWTFWAVFIFGVASIFLTVIQTILTGLQLASMASGNGNK